MNTSRINYWLLLLFLVSVVKVKGQDYPALYCLAVKQQFSAWSDCGAEPYFRSAKVLVMHGFNSYNPYDLVLNESVAPASADMLSVLELAVEK